MQRHKTPLIRAGQLGRTGGVLKGKNRVISCHMYQLAFDMLFDQLCSFPKFPVAL